MTFRYGTTRMAMRLYVEFSNEQNEKWYGDIPTNNLVGVFPTFGELFEHFSKTFENKTYSVGDTSQTIFQLRIPVEGKQDLQFTLIKQ